MCRRLLDLIATKANYVVQEVVVVIKDILPKYPGYEGVVPTLCKYASRASDITCGGSREALAFMITVHSGG